MLQVSTGYANGILVAGSLKSLLNGFHVFIYSGTVPDSADAAIPADAVLLCDVSGNGNGEALQLAVNATAGRLEKESTQVWQGTNKASGKATFCRLALPADTGVASDTAVRIQGDVGKSGCFLNISDNNLAAGAIQKVEYLSLVQPKQ